MTYQFDANIAALYGVDEAIMIQNLVYWIRKNEANGKHFYEGRFWTYNSTDAFKKLFPFWTARQVGRILQSLEAKGVIVTGNFNDNLYNRTKWYAFGDSFLRNGIIHFTLSSNGEDETGKCSIIDNTTNINTNSNTNIAAEGGKLRGTADKSMCLFVNSRFAKYEDFAAQFTAPEFADIDIAYYYNAVADWSAQKGKRMKDWIATARNFIRGDMEKGKVHRKSNFGGDVEGYLRSFGGF